MLRVCLMQPKQVIAVLKIGEKLECKLEYNNTVYHSLRTRPWKREESVIIPLGRKRKSVCKRNFTEDRGIECRGMSVKCQNKILTQW